MSQSQKLHANASLMLREIAGEYLLIPVGEAALKLHGMISLSESGALLWKQLQQTSTEDDLVEKLLSEYDIDRDSAAADVREFLAKMNKLGILEVTDA